MSAIIRLLLFLIAVITLTSWEFLSPRRNRNHSRKSRWVGNYIVSLLDIGVLRLVFPIVAVGTAMFAAEKGWGILNMTAIPDYLAVIISVIVLDFVVYIQHVMFHAIPLLWRIHMMHHTDLDLDLTSGLRFHPFEHILSMILKMSAVALLGAPVLGVMIFEIGLNVVSMFNHSNVYMPIWLDRIIRKVIVTPDMHRVHHSVRIKETNSNFGFNLSWWDYLLGTYKDQPADGHQKMTIGHALHRENNVLSLWTMLKIPFTGKTGKYPINR